MHSDYLVQGKIPPTIIKILRSAKQRLSSERHSLFLKLALHLQAAAVKPIELLSFCSSCDRGTALSLTCIQYYQMLTSKI